MLRVEPGPPRPRWRGHTGRGSGTGCRTPSRRDDHRDTGKPHRVKLMVAIRVIQRHRGIIIMMQPPRMHREFSSQGEPSGNPTRRKGTPHPEISQGYPRDRPEGCGVSGPGQVFRVWDTRSKMLPRVCQDQPDESESSLPAASRPSGDARFYFLPFPARLSAGLSETFPPFRRFDRVRVRGSGPEYKR